MSSEDSELRRTVRGGAGATQAAAPEPENLQCPRCASSNTKFCYYNNYNLSQPRYFCRSCRRYWTRGGSLRNVPVGGGSRKNSSKRSRPDLTPFSVTPQTLPSTLPAFLEADNTTSSQIVPFNEGGLPWGFTALLGNSQQECGFMGLGGYSVGLGPGPGPEASSSFDGLGFDPSSDTWQMEGSGVVVMDGGDCFGWPGPTTGFQ